MDATAQLKAVGAERARERKRRRDEGDGKDAAAAPSSANRAAKRVRHDLPAGAAPATWVAGMAAERANDGRKSLFTYTMRGRRWVVYDGDGREFKSFRPFPASLDEIRATRLYRSAMTPLPATGVSAGTNALLGLTNAAEYAINAVSLPRNSLSSPQIALRDAIFAGCDAENDAIGTYGLEGGTRLRNIVSFLKHGEKVPRRLLEGVSGCEAICE